MANSQTASNFSQQGSYASESEDDKKSHPATTSDDEVFTWGGPDAAVFQRTLSRDPRDGQGNSQRAGAVVSSAQTAQIFSARDFNSDQNNILKAELKMVVKERDFLKKELKRLAREREDALKHSAHNYGNENESMQSNREIGSINLRYEKALIDIQLLTKQNLELSRKYDSSVKDAEYYRKLERTAYNTIQSLKLQYDQLLCEKQKIEKDFANFEEDKNDLKRAQELSGMGNDDALNKMYLTTLRKYDSLNMEFDALRKRFSEMAAAHSNSVAKLEMNKEDITRLSKQYEEACRQKNCLKQQCTEAITQWDVALRDKNKLQEEIIKIRERNEEIAKEMNAHVIQNQSMAKELKILQGERNAAMQEYSLVMSERGTVHKEMDKLQEELNLASQKIKNVEKSSIDAVKEREAMQLELETLKREIVAALSDRDRALRECNELRERFGAQTDTSKEWESPYKDYATYKQERELKMGGDDRVTSSHEMFVKAQKERLENLDQANQEVDRLRKNLEKIQNDLDECKREAEVYKSRRDWAFGERDKIVLERESIRAHCDNLRHERDRAVSDLAKALRDSDDMTKQKNEATKQLKELKEKFCIEEAEDKLSLRHKSRDSNLDFDSSQIAFNNRSLNTINLHLSEIDGQSSSRRSHGITVQAGTYIGDLAHGSPAAREPALAIGDRIVNINGKYLDSKFSIEAAQRLLDISTDNIQLITVKSVKFGNSNPSSAPLSTSSSGHNMTEDDSRDSRPPLGHSGHLNRPVGVKLRGEKDERRLGSNERVVYNVTKSQEEKGSSPWGQFKNIVRTRRYSKEREGKNEEKRKAKEQKERDQAIAQLDSVLDEYKFDSTNKNVSNNTSTVKRSKKKDKQSSGGTWPRYKGGIMSLVDTNFQNIKSSLPRKERAPLSMYFPSFSSGKDESKKSMKNRSVSHGQANPVTNVFSPHKVLESSFDRFSYISDSSASSSRPQSAIFTNDVRRNFTLDRKTDIIKERTENNSPDTSIDFSVRSGNVGKEELEYYFKKNRGGVKYTSIESEPGSGSLHPSNLPPDSFLRASPLSNQSDLPARPVSHYHVTHGPSVDSRPYLDSHAGLYSPPNVSNRPFSVYSPTASVGQPYSPYIPTAYQHTHHHAPSPYFSPLYSPRGSSPLASPSRSRDSVYSSAMPECDQKDPRNCYDPNLPSTTSSGVYNSASPAFDRVHNQGVHPYHVHPVRTIGDHRLPPHILSGGPPTYRESRTVAALENTATTLPHRSQTNTIPRSKPDTYKINTSISRPNLIGASSFVDSEITEKYLRREKENQSPAFFHREVERYFPDSQAQVFSDRFSHRGSLSPASFNITQISHSIHNRKFNGENRKPQPGEVRNIRLQKGLEPLGIQIRCLENGGVFVSSVTAGSIAEQVGIRIGDQLLEVCGINMRSATKQLASTVLSQCGNSVTILVQFNFEKYQEALEVDQSSLGSLNMGSRSGSPTPQNSPKISSSPIEELNHHSDISPLRSPSNAKDNSEHSLPPSTRSTLTKPQVESLLKVLKRQNTLTKRGSEIDSPQQALSNKQGVLENPQRYSPNHSNISPKNHSPTGQYPPTDRDGPHFVRPASSSPRNSDFSARSNSSDSRIVYIDTKKSHNLGIQMVGGNAAGIFIHAVTKDSPASNHDLRPGDRILEYNGSDLRNSTAEHAASELSKPADRVKMLVQWDYETYSKIQNQPGDSFYVRAQFDSLETADPSCLKFRKGNILYVDNTLYNNVPGQWRAWLVGPSGRKHVWGVIPSREKVEDEAYWDRYGSGTLGATDSVRRGLNPSTQHARRSFFKRRKPSRSSSRDSKELASFSDASLGGGQNVNVAVSDGNANSNSNVQFYVPVRRLDYCPKRPVILIGPSWECVSEKLVHEFPHIFCRCVPEIRGGNAAELESLVLSGDVVDYRRRGPHFEATYASQIREIRDQNLHGILDVSLSCVERLNRNQIFPIVLVLKFKHHKHIRDISDAHYSSCDKLSQKEAKEMFDITTKLEREYRHLISADITAGVNLTFICAQVKTVVQAEQTKPLWAPTSCT